MNTVSLNSNQYMAGVTPVQVNNTTYLEPLENYNPNLQVDNYEATRDKNVFDFAKGVIVGVGKGIYDMGSGLYNLGKGAVWVVTHPVKSAKWVGKTVVTAVTNPIQTAKFVASLPVKIAEGIVKPYSDAIKQGKYGEFVGRLGLDVAITLMSFNIAKGSGQASTAAGNATTNATTTAGNVVTSSADEVAQVADKIDDVANVVDDVAKVAEGGNQIAKTTVKVGEVLIGDIKAEAGAKVIINIGSNNSSVIKGTVKAAETASKGSGVVNATAQAVTQSTPVVEQVAQNLAKTAAPTITAAVEGTAATANVVNAGTRTIGTVIGAGIDKVLELPKLIVTTTGKIIVGTGKVIGKVGHAILHPIETIHWLTNPATLAGIQQGAVTGATVIGNGLRTAADLTAKGLLYAAQNPGNTAVILGAVGRASKAGEETLKGLDAIR